MTREEYVKFANALKNNYTINFDKLPEFCNMAISALSEEGEYIKKEDALGCFTWQNTKADVWYAIKNLHTFSLPDSTENKGEWIPVTERLPEVNQNVLATTRWREVTIAERLNIGPDYWFIHEGNTNAHTEDIVAWQPLPEPYKAESEVKTNEPTSET